MRSLRKTRNFRKRNIRKSKKNNRKTKRINRKGGGSLTDYDCRHFLRPSPRNIKKEYCGKTSGYTNPLGNYCMHRAKRIGRTKGFAPKFVDMTGDRWCEAVREKPYNNRGFRKAQQLRAKRMAEQAERERQRQILEQRFNNAIDLMDFTGTVQPQQRFNNNIERMDFTGIHY